MGDKNKNQTPITLKDARADPIEKTGDDSAFTSITQSEIEDLCKRLETQDTKLQENIKRLDDLKLNNDFEKERKNKQSEIEGLKSEIEGLQSEIVGLQSEIVGLQSEIVGLHEKLKVQDHKYKKLMNDKNDKPEKELQLEKKARKNELQISNLEQKLAEYAKTIEELRLKNDELEQTLDLIKRLNAKHRTHHKDIEAQQEMMKSKLAQALWPKIPKKIWYYTTLDFDKAFDVIKNRSFNDQDMDNYLIKVLRLARRTWKEAEKHGEKAQRDKNNGSLVELMKDHLINALEGHGDSVGYTVDSEESEEESEEH